MVIELQGYKIELPDPPKNKREILFWDKPKAEQFWTRTYNYTDEEFYDLPREEQDEIARREFLRCIHGVWFYNNGQSFYLTGDNYFFLTFWTIDGEYPTFLVNQAHDFYFEHHVANDPFCFGSIKLKPRREGCTQRTLSRLLNLARRSFDCKFGIQSKTSDDAQEVNFDALVAAFRKLPEWMKPMQSGSVDAREKLIFDRPRTQSNRKNQDKERLVREDKKLTLRTSIDWRATKANAYDGSKLKGVVLDEVGKWITADAYKTWGIVKRCLMKGNSMTLHGKAALLSTIADEEKESSLQAAKNFKKLWSDSDPNKRNANGFTVSGLYRWFIPVWASMFDVDLMTGRSFVDKYGYVDEAFAKQVLLQEREALKHDPEALYMLIKQKPFTVQEALDFGGADTVYDKTRIVPRLHELETWLPKDPDADQMTPYTRGNFHWVNNQRFGNVQFVPNINGKFYVMWHPHDLLNESYTNRLRVEGDRRKPYPSTQFVMGLDSFDYANKEGKGYSNGAFHIALGYNHLDPKLSDRYCLEYCYREADPEVFYEDALKALYYYGAKVNPESNTPGFIEWMRRHKQLAFVMHSTMTGIVKSTARVKDYGTATTPKSLAYNIGLIESRIAAPNTEINPEAVDHLQNFWFSRTLEQLRDYTIEKKGDYDLASSMGQTEIGLQRLQKINNQNFVPDEVEQYNSPLKTIFPRYDNSGTYARPMNAVLRRQRA